MDSVDRATAIKVGYHLRGSHVVEQAHATRELGQSELQRFVAEELLTQADFDGFTPFLDQVEAGLRDKTVAASEAHAHTAAQNLGAREVKVARRRLDRAVSRGFRHSPVRAEYRKDTHHGHSVPLLVADMRRKLALAEAHADALAKKGASRRFLDDTKAKVDALEQRDAQQETALANLPDKTRAFCEAKGRLYFAIKDINDAGHALHAADPEQAGKYNLKILYRHGARRAEEGGEPAPPPAPGPATPGEPPR